MVETFAATQGLCCPPGLKYWGNDTLWVCAARATRLFPTFDQSCFWQVVVGIWHMQHALKNISSVKLQFKRRLLCNCREKSFLHSFSWQDRERIDKMIANKLLLASMKYCWDLHYKLESSHWLLSSVQWLSRGRNTVPCEAWRQC